MIHSSTTFRSLLGLVLATLFFTSTWAHAHPQDGPHVDYRITITDAGVRYSVSINLAFIDHFAPTNRETPEALSETEGEVVMAALLEHLRANCPVSINGQLIEPIVESTELHANPDPKMLAIFPKSGMRGLIRATVLLDYPSPTPPQTVEMTWDGYPDDIISGELGPDGKPHPMTIEAQLRSEGKIRLIRFAAAAPSYTWTSSDLQEDPFAALPPVPTVGPALRLPLITYGAAMLTGLCLVIGLATISKGKTPVAAGVLAGVMIVAAGLTYDLRFEIPGTSTSPPTLSEQDARTIFEPLHANLYKAFAFADESDVYDALERSVDGPLLEELYSQIYGSLIQAEQGGVLGIVTGVEPGTLEILPLATAAAPESIGFTARHTWIVEGTVYHWGHSHSRENEYVAEFEIAATEAGWRITGHRVISQTRIDDPAAALPPLGGEI